jgi:tripartite-type tricarboxylate transporter receptor subunit TctC
LAALLLPLTLHAQPYPAKPIRLVIPFPPGGSPDIVGRLVAAKLSERLNTQVVVDNRGGAGGIIGSEIVARAVPDGYTLMFISTPHAVLPSLQKLPFDTVKAIARIGTSPNALVVNQALAARSVKEFIALARQKPRQLKRLISEGADLDYQSPAVFSQFVVEEIGRWGGVVKKAGIRLE